MRQDKVINQMGAMIRDLIKVNLERETQQLEKQSNIPRQDQNTHQVDGRKNSVREWS